MQVQRDKKTTITFVIVALVVLIALGAAGFFAQQYYALRANPNQAAEAETARLTAAVGKLYELPKDEEPIVGEVQDIEKLKEQPFFENAQNGDDILIYQKAKVAIIYRAEENKLINVGPIAIDAAPQEGGEEAAKEGEGEPAPEGQPEGTPPGEGEQQQP